MRKPETTRGWHSRGYLPHFEGGCIPQFITFRLADSLPRDRLVALRQELASLPNTEAARETQKKIEEWLDSGLGNCWLQQEQVGRLVEDALLHFDGQRYFLHAWVVMPNHVHVLVTPKEEVPLSRILHTWKSFTSKGANRILGRRGKFWQEEYFDRYIRNEKHYLVAVEYIETNPVRAGLCESMEEWPFGSAARKQHHP